MTTKAAMIRAAFRSPAERGTGWRDRTARWLRLDFDKRVASNAAIALRWRREMMDMSEIKKRPVDKS